MPNLDDIPTAGDVLADKYRIERVLGQGGMGIVLAAMHLQLERRVAIKFLLPELTGDVTLVGRFVREGRAATKIRSEHVVRILDVATMPGGTPYMVMECLDGRNLEELVEKEGRLPLQTCVDYVLQATEALAEAHALGMVHRDLKPANLFLAHRVDGSPCVKVLDFGITKVVDSTGANASLGVTKTSTVMGSPRYMSPEQMRSLREVDARADIWALGIIFYELLTGAPPFDGTTMPGLLAAILQDAPRPLSELRPDVPAGLAHAIARCLEKAPEARFADVAELAQAVAPFGSALARASAERIARVLGARSAGADAGGGSRPRLASYGSITSGTGWGATGVRPRKTALAVALGGGGVIVSALGVMAIVLVARGSHKPETAQAAAEGPAAAASTPAVPVVAPPAVAQAVPAAASQVTLAPIDTPIAAPNASAPAAVSARRPLPVPVTHKQAAPASSARPAAPAAKPTHPATTDLFDGRK